MKSFVEWIDERGFWIDNCWDYEQGKFIGDGFLQLAPHHRRIFQHCLTPREDGSFPYVTVVISMPKKSGKTALMAAVMAWYCDESPPRTEVYSMAGNKDQAKERAFEDLKYHLKNIRPEVSILDDEIIYPNGTVVKAMPMAHRTVAGSRHGMTAWDELWNYIGEPARRTWVEMTPISTVPHSLRFIVTYAGYENESELLWEIYQKGVGKEEYRHGRGKQVAELKDLPCYRNGRIFVYWDHDQRMPWQTPEYLDDQLNSPGMRASDFMRLHENRWVTTHEEFIPVEWWDDAASKFEQSAMYWPEHPYRDFPMVLGIDAAVKRDSTAVVGVVFDASRGKVVVVLHKIWNPVEGESFSLEMTVEKFVLQLYNRFKIASVVYDPTHMHQTQAHLVRAGVPMLEYKQTPERMTKASQVLYDLLRNRNLEAYPDDELRAHIQMAHARVTGRGFRIVKDPGKRKFKIDAAIALAMACYQAVSLGGVDVSEAIRIESPFSDVSYWPVTDTDQSKLPFALRD